MNLREDYSNKKVAFLGGSFNPPHNGHLMIAENVLKEFGLDEVVFLPLGTPPHKSGIASAEDRKRMCELLIEGKRGLSVSTIELEREGYTYTFDTLTFLRENHDIKELKYIIGTDTLFNIEKWYRHKEVFLLTDFICVPRPGDDLDKAMAKRTELAETYGCRIDMSGFFGPDISSTGIRDDIREGRDVSGKLSPEVERYIKEKNLYV